MSRGGFAGVLVVLMVCMPMRAGWAAESAPAPRDVPSAEMQAAAEKLVRNRHAAGYADRTPAGRWTLGRKLLAESATLADDPASSYVLLREARDVATSCGDVETAMSAASGIARRYRTPDALQSKIATLQKCMAASPSPAADVAVDACLAVVDEAIAAEAFDDAGRVCNLAESAARRGRDQRLVRAAAERQQALRQMLAEHPRALAARDLLKTKPDNAEAKLTLGRYLCWVKNDWRAGLPLLAQGSDPALKALATAELAAPAAPTAQFDLAGRWWDLASRQTPPVRVAYERHAVRWYRAARPKLTGPQKALADQRIEAASPRRTVNLLRQFDPKTCIVRGLWSARDGGLVCGLEEYERLKFIHTLPAEYDYRVSFTVIAGRPANMAIVAPVGKSALSWGIGHLTNHHLLGTQQIRGTSPALTVGESYVAVLEIRPDVVRASLNGQPIGQLPTNSPAITLGNPSWAVGDGALGVGAWRCSIHVHSVEIVEILEPAED